MWRADGDLAALDEAVLDAVFTQSSVGLHVLDPEFRLVRVNAYALGVRGLFEDDVVGRPAAETYGRAGIPLDEDVLRDVLRAGRPALDVLKRSHPPADPLREHIFSASAYRLHDRTGEPLGLVVTATDVTERERARKRLDLLHTVRERIGTSLDLGRTATDLVDATVPAFADSALVALTDAVLARLHDTTLRLTHEASPRAGVEDTTASCTYGVHDPVSGRIDAAGAGASLFAVVRPDGSVDIDPLGRTPLLGAEGPPFAYATQVLPEGSILCLVSAATAEGQGPTTEQLVAALGHPGRGPEKTADAVEQLLARDRVLLVARTLLLPESDLDEWPVLPDPSSVGPARRHVEECLTRWGVAVDAFAVSVVVSELVTNAIRYGAAPITLRLIRGERTLICEVTDGAPTAPHLRHAKAVDEGGRGLQICGSLADSWGVRYVGEGRTLWAEFAIEGWGRAGQDPS
ncbi:ATP-binding protein [Streptomyces sp. NPDC056517]|uniref:ATP-binding protein n=1 Tax=Streptomyces sp. NPDC056517 TaxID=3345848 RepID=UPI0036C0BEC7